MSRAMSAPPPCGASAAGPSSSPIFAPSSPSMSPAARLSPEQDLIRMLNGNANANATIITTTTIRAITTTATNAGILGATPTLSPTIPCPPTIPDTGRYTPGMTLWAIGLTLSGGLIISFLTVLAFGIAVIMKNTNIAPRCTGRHPNTIWRSRKEMYGVGNNNNSKNKDEGEELLDEKGDRNSLEKNTVEPSKRNILTDSFGVVAAQFKEHKKEEDPLSQYQSSREFVTNSIGQRVYTGGDTPAQAHHKSKGGKEMATPMKGDLRLDAKAPIGESPSSSATDTQDQSSSGNLLYAHPQDRGNPFLGWIPWTLHLSYDRMLRGIPGTGTRDRGMGGKLLEVNLDAIVLFRYHALCLRVTAVVCFICIGIILPLNLTACQESDGCDSGLTDYGRTTIANVVHELEEGSEDTNFFSAIFWTNQSLPHLLRLYTISLCTWYITYYALKNIKRDWRENLVLRRVYYLEADHYGNRQTELDKTIYKPHVEETDDDSESDDQDMGKRRRSNKRDPWIPHPEHRDTVPNIELYSVLVGGLPSLPDEVVNSKDLQTALGVSKRASIDWQLAVATTFFDHCVPNQPGFSSSVVAVTILPGAPELAKAWRKWYAAAGALRRLRFIRQVINEKRDYTIDEVDEEFGNERSSGIRYPTSEREDTQPTIFDESLQYSVRDSPTQMKQRVTFRDHESSAQCEDFNTTSQESQVGKAYEGGENSTDTDFQIFQSLNYGPEQQAVYSREMAQGAAACCPYGCCKDRVMRQPIDNLLKMENETILRLVKAQEELQNAQMQAAVSIVDGGDKSAKKLTKQVDSVATECMLQRNNSVGDRSTPKRLFSGNAESRAAGEEQGPSSNIKGLRVQTSGNGFSQSADGHSPTLGIMPRTPGFSPESGSSQPQNDQNFRNPNSASGFGSLREPQLLQTSLPIVKEDIGHEGAYIDQEVSLAGVSSRHSTPMVQNLNGGSSLLQKNNNQKSPHGSRSSAVLRMNSEGRFLFDNAMFDNAAMDEDEESSRVSTRAPSVAPSLRRRANTAQSALSVGDISRSSTQWNQVNSILRTNDADDHPENGSSSNKREIETGAWQKPSLKSFMSSVRSEILSSLKAVGRWTKGKTDPLTSKLAKDSTYAVVTFSSRQAAVAARHCLADGRGVQRWLSLETVPVPPLADASSCDIITCRGCCRPVTLNLNSNQLMLRRYIALASLAFIYIFYTIPITAAQSLVSPQSLQQTWPAFHDWIEQNEFLSAEIMSGLVAALLYTLFFALCPIMFKAIANSGSRATSVQEAEKYALQYYWYFMLVTAFVFTGLADTAKSIWTFSNVEQSIEELIENIAAQTPLTTAATWLNWIIVRTTMTLPLQYLLQVNSFMFDCIGWNCCARCVMGGGPGGPIPYRIYIDGGVVFLCVVALAPQSPLVAPVALLYYLVCVPLWRRNCIFMYRPKFDSGGEHWPFLSDMLITSLFMGQFLLTLQMILRDAYGPALMAAFPSVPTYLFRNYLVKRFRGAYEDAGLLQTSLLDGWDNTIPTSVDKREEFRQFLVDAHKAAYIPVCIAGGATNILTAEPALVMPSENDDMLGYGDVSTSGQSSAVPDTPLSPYFGDQSHLFPSANGMRSDSEGNSTPTLSNQNGAYVRRTMSYSGQTPRSSSTSVNAERGTGSPTSTSNLWQKVQDQVDISSADAVDPGCAQS